MARKFKTRKISGKKVLLIDDDQEYLEATKRLLENEGHVVSFTKNGIDTTYIKNDIRVYLTNNQYLDKIYSDLNPISDEDIQKAYEKYTNEEVASVRHILLMTQGKKAEEKKEAEALAAFFKGKYGGTWRIDHKNIFASKIPLEDQPAVEIIGEQMKTADDAIATRAL